MKRGWFVKVDSFDSVTGKVTWKDHKPQRPVFVVRVKNGETKIVQTLDPDEARLPFEGTVRLRSLEGGAVVETDIDGVMNCNCSRVVTPFCRRSSAVSTLAAMGTVCRLVDRRSAVTTSSCKVVPLATGWSASAARAAPAVAPAARSPRARVETALRSQNPESA